MGQNQCNCFSKRAEEQLNLNITQEQNIAENHQTPGRNYESFFTSDHIDSCKSSKRGTKNKMQSYITIQKIYRGFKYRNHFNLIKPKMLEEETKFINLTKVSFNSELFEKYENLNPNYKTPLPNTTSTPIKKYLCKLLIQKGINKETNEAYTSIYYGQVDISNKKNGIGTFITSYGKKYEGYWIQNELNSLGRVTDLSEGCTTEGLFLNGKLNGKGKRYWEGIVYEGDFVNNIREGKGKEDTVEYSYEGDFKNDTKEGKGKVYYFLTKDRYEGEFKDNSITGFGLYTWANNHTYKGEFLLQQMNGEGIYTYPDGGYYKGHYVNNIKEGYGEFKWKNGKIFRGNFKNGKPYGKGILINNGEEKEVNFSENGQ